MCAVWCFCFSSEVQFHNWKNRFVVQKGKEKKGGGKSRVGERVNEKEITPLIYSILWKHGITIRGSQLCDMSLKQTVSCFIYFKPCMETISNSRPLMNKIQHIYIPPATFLSNPTLPSENTNKQRELQRKSAWEEAECMAHSRVAFASLWRVKYTPDKLFLLPQKRAMANWFNGFPLR